MRKQTDVLPSASSRTHRLNKIMGWYPWRFVPLSAVAIACSFTDSWLSRGVILVVTMLVLEIIALLGTLRYRPRPNRDTPSASYPLAPVAAATDPPAEPRTSASGDGPEPARRRWVRTLIEIFACYTLFGFFASMFDLIYLAGQFGGHSPSAPNEPTNQIMPIIFVGKFSPHVRIFYVTPVQGLIYWLLYAPMWLFFGGMTALFVAIKIKSALQSQSDKQDG